MKYQPLLLLLASFHILSAQPTYFEGFETFVPSGQPAPFDWAEPKNWASSNALTEFIAPGVTQTEEAYEGNFAVRLDSRRIFNKMTSAKLALGAAQVDYISNGLITDGAGMALEGELDKLSGYYKYGPTGQGSLRVRITRFDNGERLAVFETDYLFSPTTDFSPFEISFDGYSFEEGKDTLLLAFRSTADEETAVQASSLIVDALSLAYLTALEEQKAVQRGRLLVSPVPASAGQKLHISLEGNQETGIHAVSLFSANGLLLYHSTANPSAIDLSRLPLFPGLYLVVAETNSGSLLAEKLIVASR